VICRNNRRPGQFYLPYVTDCSNANDPHVKQIHEGIHGRITLRKGLDMKSSLLQTLLFDIAVSGAVAWVDSKAAVHPGDRMMFLAFVTTGFYSFARGSNVIWGVEGLSGALKYTADAAACGLATAAIFQYWYKIM